MDAGQRGPAIFLSAGEASGDQHAAAVAREIRARLPTARLYGLGGPDMEAAGVELLATLDQLAVMGFAEVVTRLPFFVGLRRRVRRLLRKQDVKLVIPVDYPGFNLGLAGWAHGAGCRVLYFVAPQVWAWKEGRAKKLAEVCDRVLTVLPFEAKLLERYGVNVSFVGHPLLDHGPVPRARGDETPADRVIGLFPGSRAQEVRVILPVFAAAARLLSERHPDLVFLVAQARSLPSELYDRVDLPKASPAETVSRSHAAMTKSGTITLELALADVPMVIGYRTTRVTYAIAKRMLRLSSIGLVNLVADESFVPEFIQDRLTPEGIARGIEPLLVDQGPVRTNMQLGFAQVRSRLGEPGCARRVAEHAVALLE